MPVQNAWSPCARQHDDPHRVVDANMTPEGGELILHSLVERVVHFRPIQRHRRDMVMNGIGDGTEIIRYDHGCSSAEHIKRPNVPPVSVSFVVATRRQ